MRASSPRGTPAPAAMHPSCRATPGHVASARRPAAVSAGSSPPRCPRAAGSPKQGASRPSCAQASANQRHHPRVAGSPGAGSVRARAFAACGSPRPRRPRPAGAWHRPMRPPASPREVGPWATTPGRTTAEANAKAKAKSSPARRSATTSRPSMRRRLGSSLVRSSSLDLAQVAAPPRPRSQNSGVGAPTRRAKENLQPRLRT